MSVELSPDDVRIDVCRTPGNGPCAVRVTHLPTGQIVTVDDQATTEDNRNRALNVLRASLSWDRTQPWTAPARSVVLWRAGHRWRYAIHSEAGIFDGGLGDLDEQASADEAQMTLLGRIRDSTGLTYAATWSLDRADWWSAELTAVTPT